MDVYEALYTTRAMRRVRPDPIPQDAQARILDAAIRAPSGGNAQAWRFLLVDDRATKERLGPLYRESIAETLQIVRSAQYLADHFEQTPLLLFAFAPGESSGGSIFPAVWSAMLA